MEVKKSKEQIIEDLKNFIGRDVPEEVYDVVAGAADMHPGTALIDINAYRNAAKATDNKNIAFWLAAQQRKKEDVLVVNQGKDGNPVLDSSYDWMSIREIADYFMEDVNYIQELFESVNFDMTSGQLEPELKHLKEKRDFYLALSDKTGPVDLPVGEELKKITLAQLSEYLHIPFMELYTRYELTGKADVSIEEYSDSLRKQAENRAFAQVVNVEEFMFEKELDSYHVMLMRASMKKMGLQHSIRMKETYQFKKVEDYYILFLKELNKKEQKKEYYTEEEKQFLREMETEIKNGKAVQPEQSEYLIALLQTKQITKKDNTRLFLHLADKV